MNKQSNASIPQSSKTAAVSRVRQRTRLRLIAAAESVMARHGVEGATIQAITEEAELGIGTFYNHFESKEELAKAVFALRAEGLGKVLDFISGKYKDPAKAIGYIQRTYVERSLADPIWGWFLIRAEFALRQYDETFRDRARTDILRGIQAKRFTCSNCIETAITVTLSSLFAVTKQILEGRADKAAAMELNELLLRMYGLSAEEAAKLARSPLPDFDAMLKEAGPRP
ncbi:TetR/AcrR family transcriptional regulator [Eoetvoesiella caeni]|uniref:TetR family transcriptional regulator n=2 Tax=Eoetvoesiella caeni TaxID=645616 RepID=A0A366HCW9_9BURK|nr:TetR/AcrR family transcriptional regulator [Eoetvoesiella caeni]MCI2809160.1 TetR/AcrR family transcriptional regulator [Eoetvoesiella caeni]NYT54302.1 TetR/AcrR family transcriptional regulator [Eoetvoesiella caeni]RBP39513.1 TetR family transcriptional regulator [Eoetvoesiella caeni]